MPFAHVNGTELFHRDAHARTVGGGRRCTAHPSRSGESGGAGALVRRLRRTPVRPALPAAAQSPVSGRNHGGVGLHRPDHRRAAAPGRQRGSRHRLPRRGNGRRGVCPRPEARGGQPGLSRVRSRACGAPVQLDGVERRGVCSQPGADGGLQRRVAARRDRSTHAHSGRPSRLLLPAIAGGQCPRGLRPRRWPTYRRCLLAARHPSRMPDTCAAPRRSRPAAGPCIPRRPIPSGAATSPHDDSSRRRSSGRSSDSIPSTCVRPSAARRGRSVHGRSGASSPSR
jgi:hypothetical protein